VEFKYTGRVQPNEGDGIFRIKKALVNPSLYYRKNTNHCRNQNEEWVVA